MERKKYTAYLILFLFLFQSAVAIDKEEIYKAYINGNMSQWKLLIDEMYQQNQNSNDYILELINYQYGYIAWCIGNKEYDLAQYYLDKATTKLEILEKEKYKLTDVYAYKSAFIGYHIGLNLYKAPFIGNKSLKFANQSIELDRTNYFGYIQLANNLFFRPEVFGGSKTEALEQYLKAQTLIEKNSDLTDQNWNYLSLLVAIARAYEEMDKFDMAKNYYIKILKIEPNFKWVKDELLPALNKKLK